MKTETVIWLELKWRKNHCRTNTSVRINKEIQKSRSVRVNNRDPSKKVNHKSKAIWYRKIITGGFYPSTFACSHFSPKIQFLYCLFSSLSLWGGGHQSFRNSSLQIAEISTLSCLFIIFACSDSNLSLNFKLLWGVFKTHWLERYVQLFFMCLYKYLNQRKPIVNTMENLLRVIF